MSEEKLYPDSHPIDAEPYYSRHVEAMTVEGLYSKAMIVLQLAVRDNEIAELKQSNIEKQAEIDRLLVAVANQSVRLAGKASIKPQRAATKPKSRVFRDGDMYCAVFMDFINLQESPAGFGDTPKSARTELYKTAMRKAEL